MQISFLIVTKNRPNELALTLIKLRSIVDLSAHEVLVFIDGCPKTELIIKDFQWVKWTVSKESVSASPARHLLYQKAVGTIFIGLDDDAHPISVDFINQVEKAFQVHDNLGILAFQEVRGLFESDTDALTHSKRSTSYFTNDFVGCGFAVLKEVYNATDGFPVWMDIYGEESALAIEVLDLGFKILYEPLIQINHRVDVEKRKQLGRNYFRFEHQLKNTIRFFIVYYKYPMLKILKVLWHNFVKYGLKNWRYFKSLTFVVFGTLFSLRKILKHRNPVKTSTLKTRLSLKLFNY